MEDLRYLNVGCGDRLLAGFRNVDLPDFDATKPWKIETGSLLKVNMDCVLPHIQDGEAFNFIMNEVARALIPGIGVFTFSAPDWRNPREALQDVHHYRLIGPRTFYHYTRESTNRPLEANGVWFEGPSWKHRPLNERFLEGESIILPNVLRIGVSNLGILSHVAYRFNLRFMLRSGRLNWSMKRNGKGWIHGKT